ncbi:hypothetical protein vseg_013149 [Gypsophila vaccaria]
MIGTGSKGSESKFKVIALVPSEPEPLNVITVEGTDGPNDELEKNDNLNRESVIEYGMSNEDEPMTDEIDDEKQGTGFAIDDMIVEGNERILMNVDTEEEDVNDGGDAVTDSDVHDRNEGANEEEMEEDEELVSGGSDDEDVHTAEEEEPEADMSDGGDTVSNADAVNNSDGANEETEEDEEPVSCGFDDEEVHTAEEEEPEEDMSDGDDYVNNVDAENNDDQANEETEEDEEPVSCGSDDDNVHAGEEAEEDEEEGADITTCLTNTNEGLDATKHVQGRTLTDNANNDKEANELTAEERFSVSAENGEDESIKETASIAIEVKTVAEKVTLPKKKIIRRRLIKKKISPCNTVAGDNESQMQPSDGNEGSGALCKAIALDEAKPQSLEDQHREGQTGNLKNEEKLERKPKVKVVKKRVRIRKNKPQSEAPTGSVGQKPKPTRDDPASKDNQSIEQKIANEGAGKSKAKFSHLDNRKNEKVLEEGVQKVNAKDVDKPGSSKSGKLKVESQGMIFICSSETKKDCYRYNIFGLPAAKKDVVARIYKGMRLFLFDVDLRMLYGIYKAAGQGSYNVEPKAFKSRYPSQVRFTVLKDCVPIAEEKFKRIIKANYYTNTKFNCQLNSVQVRNLCKLFTEIKKSESKRGLQSQIPFSSPSARVNKKRKRAEDSRRVGPGAISSRSHERRRIRLDEVSRVHMVRDREERRHAPAVRGHEEPRRAPAVRGHEESRRAPAVRGHEESRHAPAVRGLKESRRAPAVRGHEESRRAPAVRGHEEARRAPAIRGQEESRRAVVVRGHAEVRRAPVAIDERYRDPVLIYGRDVYPPPIESSALYQPSRAEDLVRSRVYSYERDPGGDSYRRDSAMDYRDLGSTGSRESRHYVEQIGRDPYVTYREPHVYREPVYETAARREQNGYSSAERRYASDYYRSDDYRSPVTLHRRY